MCPTYMPIQKRGLWTCDGINVWVPYTCKCTYILCTEAMSTPYRVAFRANRKSYSVNGNWGHRTGTSRSHTSNIVPERLAGRVWIAILLGMLYANETGISSDRGLGLWLVCTVTFLLFLMRAYTNKLSKGKNHREFMFFWKPINANTHWWRSLKSPDSSPYHRTTVTDTNSSDLEVESCHKRIWCPTIKIKNVQCGCAPVTTQFIWMLAKKLKKNTITPSTKFSA